MDTGLLNISSVDGRYQKDLSFLNRYFSESALIKNRVVVEIEFLKYLSRYQVIKKLSAVAIKKLDKIKNSFSVEDAQAVKTIEKETKHDIKAVEYWLRKKIIAARLSRLSPFIHFGTTSDDINNLAIAVSLRQFKAEVLDSQLNQLLDVLKKIINENKDISWLARTHGQPAVGTTFGKEIGNFYYRLQKQQARLKNFKFEGKVNGAVGNFNSFQFIFDQVDWIKFSSDFVNSLGLQPNLITTQILPYDNWLEFFEIIVAINGILIGLCQDFWSYIMLKELKLKKMPGQVGSSTMPQKLNPISFELAEGNLQLAVNLFQFFSSKLRSSRLQRDLTDSSVRRNFGTALAWTILAWQSLRKGLAQTSVDLEVVQKNLNEHWEVLAEPVQLYLRLTGDDKGYEKLKQLTQQKQFLKEDYLRLIKQLKLDKNKKFTQLTPTKYTGLAKKLVSIILDYKF